jgi:hypothetical protein
MKKNAPPCENPLTVLGSVTIIANAEKIHSAKTGVIDPRTVVKLGGG